MLKTVDEIVDALGGTAAAASAAGMEPSAISMWKARGKIPPNRFLMISRLLLQAGQQADPTIFGFIESGKVK